MSPPYSHVATTCSVVAGAYEWTKYIHNGAESPENIAESSRMLRRFHCICGRLTPSGSNRTLPESTPIPDVLASSSELSYSICIPMQIPMGSGHALGGRHGRPVDAHGVAQAPGHAFERGLEHVVGVLPADLPHVQRDPGAGGEGPPELLGQLRVERWRAQRLSSG